MPFTVDDFHDFIRLIETRPEWRTELRRLVLTNELLAVPEQLTELRARSEQQFIALSEAQQRTEAQVTTLTVQVTTLAEAQQRTEARLTALAEAQQRTEAQVATLTGQVTTLTVQVTALTRTVQTLVDDVGELKGQNLEAVYRSKGPAYFSRLLRRPHVLTPDELTALVEEA
jgi:chromosome segregation ATPase